MKIARAPDQTGVLMAVVMSRAPKKPADTSPTHKEPTTQGSAPSKIKVQFGPSATAPGSRLKKAKGS